MAIRKRIPYVDCPLCGHEKYEVVREVDIALGELMTLTLERKLQWRKCAVCEHIYADGYWPDEIMLKILARMPPMAFDLKEERVAWGGIVEKVMLTMPPTVWESGKTVNDCTGLRWLDVGCGHGCGRGNCCY